MEKLKPCPFCGSKAEIQIDKDLHSYVIKCTQCPVNVGRYWQLKKAEAIKLWNKRVDNNRAKYFKWIKRGCR